MHTNFLHLYFVDTTLGVCSVYMKRTLKSISNIMCLLCPSASQDSNVWLTVCHLKKTKANSDELIRVVILYGMANGENIFSFNCCYALYHLHKSDFICFDWKAYRYFDLDYEGGFQWIELEFCLSLLEKRWL